MKKINRKITAIQGNERNSSVLYEEANAKFDVLDVEYQAEKAKDTFEVGQDFTRKVEGLRETQNAAFRLQDNVKALMEEVNAYKKEWEDLQARHRQIKAQVDDKKVSCSAFYRFANKLQNMLNAIKNRAKEARNQIHQKLYKTEACTGSD